MRPLPDVRPPERRRAYDKGERRRKHVTQSNKPEIKPCYDSPRRVEGKCPANIPDDVRDRLLERAVPLPNPDRNLKGPKKIYAVLEGVIYEAQTSDQGRTYHAYPFKGKLGDGIISALRQMSIDDKCLDEFEGWLKKNVTRHGK